MEPKNIPQMIKDEYDDLINEQFMSRISFQGEQYPKIKPFLYYFDGNFTYFLATRYGEKLQLLENNPRVTVEIEKYKDDMSDYKFVTLSGRLVEVEGEEDKKEVKKWFVRMIKEKDLSKNVMAALRHSPEEPVEAIIEEERNLVLKLVNVDDITGLKSG